MNVEEMANKLKAENPALYDFIIGQGRKKELARVRAHLALGEKTKATKFMRECIENGASITDEDVHAQYIVAGMDAQDTQNRADDNPPDTNTPDVDMTKEDKIMDEVDAKLGISSRAEVKHG